MRLNVTAIGLGIVSDFVLSVLGSICLSLAGITTGSPELYIWSLILGLGAIAAGGYVTFIKSPTHTFANTVTFGIAEVLIGVLVAVASSMPVWFTITSAVLIIPASLVGGYLGKVRTA